ncbi:MAG: serine--tRNA ligase [Spirochaetota bacterium]|nr:serine--tRNA ligase [Spirochaetota bacterium]
MLDIDFIEKNRKKIEQSAANKKFPIDLSNLLKTNEKRKNLIKKVDDLRNERNKISKDIANLQGDDKQKAIIYGKDLRNELSALEYQLDDIKKDFENLMLKVPNLHLDEVPIGESDADNVEIRKWGTPKVFDFKPKSHLELGESLNIIDFPRGVKIAGHKQYFLKNEGTLLEIAVLQYALNFLLNKGFTPYTVPLMVKKEAMTGTGYFPGGEDQAYAIERDNAYLIGTSEVALCSYYKDEILNESDLPVKMLGLSNCFRREAGTYGKDTQGLYRIHQFQKVEQVLISKNSAEESKRLHFELLNNAEEILKSLGLAHRVVIVCTGDLGMGQVIKHDIETWMPSRESYGETHSCSSLYEYQSRRLNIKYRNKEGHLKFAHTLNNTCIASPRILIPLLENNQREDGSIEIPFPLHPYMHGITQIKPKN